MISIKKNIGHSAAAYLAALLFAALLVVSGCGDGTGLPENNITRLESGRSSPAISQVRNTYIDGKFRPALESKDLEKITGLFDPEFARGRYYVENLLGIMSVVNNPSFEVIRSTVTDSSDSALKVTIYYCLKGYCGMGFDEFSKRGLMVFKLRSSAAPSASASSGTDAFEYSRIYDDDFPSYYHITGRVLDDDGNPSASAKVTVKTQNFTYSATTFANGYFSIEYLCDPAVTVSVEKTGFKTVSRLVERLEKGSILEMAPIRIEREVVQKQSGYNERGYDTSEATFTQTNRDASGGGTLSAIAYNSEVRLFWNLPEGIRTEEHNFIVWRRSPADSAFVRAGEVIGATHYEDTGLSNGSTYIYKVEVRQQSAPASKQSFKEWFVGPVMAVPSSFTIRMEFEKLLEGAMKWKGEKPSVLSGKGFSDGAYLSFNPLLTSSLSFLTPIKVKSGEYRIFLYAKRMKKTMPVKITIRQFGDTDDNFYMCKTVDLRAFAAGEARDIIDLGTIQINSTDWKNEKIAEDYSDIAVSVVYPDTQKASGGHETDDEKSKEQPSVALDLLEMIKAD